MNYPFPWELSIPPIKLWWWLGDGLWHCFNHIIYIYRLIYQCNTIPIHISCTTGRSQISGLSPNMTWIIGLTLPPKGETSSPLDVAWHRLDDWTIRRRLEGPRKKPRGTSLGLPVIHWMPPKRILNGNYNGSCLENIWYLIIWYPFIIFNIWYSIWLNHGYCLDAFLNVCKHEDTWWTMPTHFDCWLFGIRWVYKLSHWNLNFTVAGDQQTTKSKP